MSNFYYKKPLPQGLYAITPPQINHSIQLMEKVGALLEGGIRYLQYRDKSNIKQEREQIARRLKYLCYDYEVPFIVNDDIVLAKAVDADGVHLGQEDINIKQAREYLGHDILIGASCYGNLKLAQQCIKDSADYIAFGSFFHSPTKPKAKLIKPEILKVAKKHFKVPICAIGGITLENSKVLVEQGADWLAVISALFDAPNPELMARKFARIFEQK